MIVNGQQSLNACGGPGYTSELLRLKSSLQEVFCKKVVLKNFVKFTGKSKSLLIKMQAASLLRKRL